MTYFLSFSLSSSILSRLNSGDLACSDVSYSEQDTTGCVVTSGSRDLRKLEMVLVVSAYKRASDLHVVRREATADAGSRGLSIKAVYPKRPRAKTLIT